MDTEALWKGEFGDQYTERNTGRVENNLHLFGQSDICSALNTSLTLIEFGAGSGDNLEAIRQFYPHLGLAAVEINEKAASHIRAGDIYRTSVFDFNAPGQWDVVLTKGFLIHVPPEKLSEVYHKLWRYARKYILICEYYNPTPVEIPYRGQEGALWKRDFAGEMLDMYPDLKLDSYGFVYHRDPYPQDDLTWFLLEQE